MCGCGDRGELLSLACYFIYYFLFMINHMVTYLNFENGLVAGKCHIIC